MESPRKRLKKEDSSTASSFLNLAEEGLAGTILSYCDFQTLLRIRYVNSSHRQFADGEIDQVNLRTVKSLPVDYENGGNDGGYRIVKLQLGWTEKYPTKEALIDEALTYCDPGDPELEGTDYDDDRARRLLEVTGWVGVDDFDEKMQEEEWKRLNRMRNSEGDSPVGWNVQIHYKSYIKRLVTAKKMVEKILGMESYETAVRVDGDYQYVIRYDLQFVDAKILSLRHGVMCLLWSAAQPQSLRYTDMEHKYRHTDYPSGGCEAFLIFRTVDNQMIELNGSYRFDVH